MPKAEPSRDATDGLAGGLAPPDGEEDLRDDTPDTRRRSGSKGEQDFDVRNRRASPAPPHVVIDLRTKAPVSRRRFLLGLTGPPVRLIRHGIRVAGAWFDPV